MFVDVELGTDEHFLDLLQSSLRGLIGIPIRSEAECGAHTIQLKLNITAKSATVGS